MYTPSIEEFLELSKKANVIPVYKEINADLDTPVSAFLKIKKDEYAFLFESVEGQEKIARYSFLGTRPALIFKSKGNDIQITYPFKNLIKKIVVLKNPLDEIKKIMRNFKGAPIKGPLRFYGGLVGYISYDSVRFFEKIPDKNSDDLKTADFIFILTDTLLIFDHVNHTIKIVSNIIFPKLSKFPGMREKTRLYKEAINKIEAIEKDFSKPLRTQETMPQGVSAEINIPKSNYKRSEFERIIREAKSYIKKGDIIQCVLSQRFEVRINKTPFDIYRSLRSINPSPYMFFLKLGDVILIGSSPEMLVRCENGIVQTRPIAGTRPRGKTEAEDRKLQDELSNDIKEKAEHIMLVDLGRNDLGRVCKSGSITVREFMGIEKYSHVMHLVTEIEGALDAKYDIYDVLQACFPAGTVTGSPKIRAMEIIDSLENSKRGPYAGCVGYFSFSQNMDTCITIRTIVIKDGIAYVQAGMGVVSDSIPEKEYYESVNKAKALIEAITK